MNAGTVVISAADAGPRSLHGLRKITFSLVLRVIFCSFLRRPSCHVQSSTGAKRMRVRHGMASLVACLVAVPFGQTAAGEKPIYQDAQVAEKTALLDEESFLFSGESG